jgi:hypothetical protein
MPGVLTQVAQGDEKEMKQKRRRYLEFWLLNLRQEYARPFGLDIDSRALLQYIVKEEWRKASFLY